MKRSSLLFTFVFFFFSGFTQTPFDIQLEAVSIPELGGLQSYAWGQHDGYWLILGGRLDGLHRRQPWASFDEAGLNNQIIVVDPVGLQKWTAPLSSLPTALREQLSATNMEFYQEGDYLYLIGGYGFSTTAQDHLTHPYLAAIKVSAVIDAVINETAFSSFFRQVADTNFAVTGGYLEKIEDIFYLVGGQRFDGAYNPMNHPTFTQEYTNSIRRFTLEDDGVNLTITHLPSWTDANNLHRRDLNVSPQIMPDGQEGLTIFSGVFQQTADLPYLNSVDIRPSGYEVNPDFIQYFNHYHCANISIYSADQNEMHNLFFGGMAQYYVQDGVLMQDDNVPFVNTIARVTRSENGNLTEYKLDQEMPGYLGSGSEFIPVQGIPAYANSVLQLDEIPENTLIGYIYGGINSTAANIFWINDGTQSVASSQIFKVYLTAPGTSGTKDLSERRTGKMDMQVFPNPNSGIINISMHLGYRSAVTLKLIDQTGRVIYEAEYPEANLQLGNNRLEVALDEKEKPSVIFVTLESNLEIVTRKLILER
ncbi:MAG: T9SS C-terminal target domain-containing protein [Saprospiraceae bacterium]|nr:T9SS C-terminal target domain-containing protein [Saprospiraceae bacterium]